MAPTACRLLLLLPPSLAALEAFGVESSFFTWGIYFLTKWTREENSREQKSSFLTPTPAYKGFRAFLTSFSLQISFSHSPFGPYRNADKSSDFCCPLYCYVYLLLRFTTIICQFFMVVLSRKLLTNESHEFIFVAQVQNFQ